jgi:hypothetical protein
VLAIAACQAKAVVAEPRAEAVDVEKADPPPGSRGLGIVYAVHGGGCGVTGDEGNYDGAVALLRNKAVQRGGNYVQILTTIAPHTENSCFDNRFVIRAVIYRVAPVGPVGGEASIAKATPGGCVPPCSPGYACESGACLAQCNPPCGANETCRQDRTCAAVAH